MDVWETHFGQRELQIPRVRYLSGREARMPRLPRGEELGGSEGPWVKGWVVLSIVSHLKDLGLSG